MWYISSEQFMKIHSYLRYSYFSTEKSYQIKPESDCINHSPIDLEQQTDVDLIPDQSEND